MLGPPPPPPTSSFVHNGIDEGRTDGDRIGNRIDNWISNRTECTDSRPFSVNVESIDGRIDNRVEDGRIEGDKAGNRIKCITNTPPFSFSFRSRCSL